MRKYREVSLFQRSCALLEGDIGTATYIKAAWAILVAKLLDSTEVIFGVATADESLVPVRIPIDWNRDVRELLSFVQQQGEDLEHFKRLGLHRIRGIDQDAASACDFQSILSINNNHLEQEDLHNFGLLFKYNTSTFGSHVSFKFDANVLSENQVTRLFYQFEHVYQQLLVSTAASLKLKSLSFTSRQDLQDIWNWNANVPQEISDNIPSMIRRTVHQQPLATAIYAWDGSLTYQELDDISTALAHRLCERGVQRGDTVPLCFEKSMWMPVAALAVMKTGAACVATDPSTQPEERLRAMVSQVEAKTILTSGLYADLASKLGAQNVMCVDNEKMHEFTQSMDTSTCLAEICPSDILYVIFTSGTTGVPKGAMVTHGNFCSAIVHQRDLLGFESTAHVLDFSSHAFDVSWSNLLNTLTVGACLCIPSAEERQDSVSGCLEKYKITLSDFTPSLLRNIEPKTALSRLSTMVLGGEVVLPSDAQYAHDDARVVSAYGPAECTPTSMILHLSADSDGGLGRACGLCTWVVDVDNPNRLAPIGSVGELWLEGPLVGPGYVKNSEKTREAFSQDPEWLVQGVAGQRHGRCGQVYRTGDLVQYREDGSLVFKGRKDTQVKIRGQRVELEEVEQHVQDVITAAEPEKIVTVVAETITPTGSSSIALVAFICLAMGSDDAEHDKAVRKATAGMADTLSGLVPAFMIPSIFIPVRKMPMTATGKTDRRQLREFGSSLSSTDIAALSRSDGERRAPTNDSEQLMQGLWAEVLNIEPGNIGIDDSFFRIGGDSIGAMKLVGLARRTGLSLAVRDVFQRPIMRDLCTLSLFGK
jgi:amino acid adenylation domain-containing protein